MFGLSPREEAVIDFIVGVILFCVIAYFRLS